MVHIHSNSDFTIVADSSGCAFEVMTWCSLGENTRDLAIVARHTAQCGLCHSDVNSVGHG